MDELLPLNKNSTEFQTIFGDVNDVNSAASRLHASGITDAVVTIINADPVLRQDVYAYYQTILNGEPRPDTSGNYQSGPISIANNPELSGQFVITPPDQSIGQPNYVGTVQISSSQFADAIGFTTTLSHELSGHFTQRYIHYFADVSTPEQAAVAYLQTEALSHLRQAQTAEAAQAEGYTISAELQTEVSFLQQERTRINSENPEASPETKQTLLVSAFNDRLSEPNSVLNPYSRLVEAMEAGMREHPTLLTTNGEVFGITLGRDAQGNPIYVYTKGDIVMEGTVSVNGMCFVYSSGNLETKIITSPQHNMTIASFDEVGNLASAEHQQFFDDGSSITIDYFPDGAMVTTARDSSGVVISQVTQDPSTSPVDNSALDVQNPVSSSGTPVEGDGTTGPDGANFADGTDDLVLFGSDGQLVYFDDASLDGFHNLAGGIVTDGWRPGGEELSLT